MRKTNLIFFFISKVLDTAAAYFQCRHTISLSLFYNTQVFFLHVNTELEAKAYYNVDFWFACRWATV